MSFFTGTPDSYKQVSTLTPEQQPLHTQLRNAAQQKGAGGAYGGAADYYRDLLSDDSQTAQMMNAPELRRFNEQIIPDLAEQFAGMGSGGLSSSGFRNAAVGAGTDLSERLGAIRAQLRSQGAQGLMNIGNQALNPVTQNVHEQGTPGLIDYSGPIAGSVIGAAAGPIGSALGSQVGSWISNSNKGKTSPYGQTSAQGYDQQFRTTGVY